MIILILLFSIFYFILAYRRLDWAIMLLIVALPSYLIRFNILGIPMTVLEAMMLISFAVWFLKNYKTIIYGIRRRFNWKLKIGNWKFVRYPFDIEIVLLLIISFVSVGVAGWSNAAFGIWKAYFFEPALFFILVLNVFREPLLTPPFAKGRNSFSLPLRKGGLGWVEKIIFALAIGALAVSALAIYQKITGQLIDNTLWQASATRRVVSFFGYPNAVGLYLGPIVMVFIGYFFSVIARRQASGETTKQSPVNNMNSEIAALPLVARNDKILRCFIALTAILSLLSIYFAKSIGAVIGLAAALLIFGLLAGKKIRRATIIVAFMALVSILVIPSARVKVIDKMTFQDLSGQIRLEQWRETWQMMASSPARFIFGTGLSGYQRAIAPYHQEGIFFNSDHESWEIFHRKTVFNEEYRRTHWQPVEIYMYPHNILLNFWSELGLAGVLLFIWIIGKFFVIGIWNLFGNWKFEIGNLETQKNRYIVRGLISAMIVVVVHGLVDAPYFKNDLSVIFWLLVAMMSIVNLNLKFANKKNVQ